MFGELILLASLFGKEWMTSHLPQQRNLPESALLGGLASAGEQAQKLEDQRQLWGSASSMPDKVLEVESTPTDDKPAKLDNDESPFTNPPKYRWELLGGVNSAPGTGEPLKFTVSFRVSAVLDLNIHIEILNLSLRSYCDLSLNAKAVTNGDPVEHMQTFMYEAEGFCHMLRNIDHFWMVDQPSGSMDNRTHCGVR